MADNAFATARFPGYTTDELKTAYSRASIGGEGSRCNELMSEIERREAVNAGDVSRMTDGERLRFQKTGKAR